MRAADDGEEPVGGPGLVVHSAVEAAELAQELDRSAEPAVADAARVEDADVDVGGGWRADACQRFLITLEEKVVDQNAHPDATLRGFQDAVEEQLAGGPGLPEVELDVERGARRVDQGEAPVKGVLVGGEQQEGAMVFRATGGKTFRGAGQGGRNAVQAGQW